MDPRQQREIIYLSILLHILLLLLWEGASVLNFFKAETPEPVPVEEPIVFEIQPQKPSQVIETPDDAKVVEKQKQADYLSDKNALARNPETDPDLRLGDAYAKGDLNTHDLPVQPMKPGQPRPQTPPIKKQQQQDQQQKKSEPREDQKIDPDDLMVESAGTAFIREYVMNQPNPLTQGATERLPGVRHDQRDTRAEDMGGLSFNTYNWNFAPYLLMLKKRIQRNIYPPAAFTQLGLISGETLLRFRIEKDGRLSVLKILDYKGHKTLMETSERAVNVSAPFPELPSDFPEEYLEVTGKFIYFISSK